MTTLSALLTTKTLDRLAKEVQEHLDRGAELITRGAEEWIAAGGKLAEARELCGHGEWAPWLKRHLPELTQQTALNYIRLFKRFGHMDDDKLKIVFNLPGEVSACWPRPTHRRTSSTPPSTAPQPVNRSLFR